MAPTMEKNPITGVREPYFPERMRLPRIISGIGVIIIMVRTSAFPFPVFNFRFLLTVQNRALRVLSSFRQLQTERLLCFGVSGS